MPPSKRVITDGFILVALFVAFFAVSMKRHSVNVSGTINSDTKGYYIYLPALFVYKDIHKVPLQDFPDPHRNDKGEYYTKYTCGVAAFYLPFFIGAHVYANVCHLNASGFSDPYCYAMILCGVFWSFVGIYLLKRLLEKYFSWATTWVTLLCIMLGTNFFSYATLDIGMSHVYNFTLFAAAILVTDSFYENPTKRKAILLALLLGWIVLIRPTNIVLGIFLVLYKTVSLQDIKQRMTFLRAHATHFLVGFPFFIAVMIPQMFYWKAMTDKWIKYTYEGEGFTNWKNPKIAEVLFDTQNGLFLYSPVLLFFFFALFFKRKDPRTNFWGISIVFAVITYIFASWWAWWFGGAFGHRCYIDYFPLFAFPLAVTVESVFKSRFPVVKIAFLFVAGVFCYYTVALSQMYMDKAIWDGPEWRWNWKGWQDLLHQVF
jgi:hypothetical protein